MALLICGKPVRPLSSTLQGLFVFITLTGLLCATPYAALAAASTSAPKNAQATQKEKDTYLRAVYVLRSLDANARAESVVIPRRVVVADATESLLRHPDSVLVLQQISGDLAKLREKFPDALLYESYARFALGLRQEGTDRLTAYVAISPYSARHYAILCYNLKELRDYVDLYIIAREWAERDPSCQRDRFVAEWHGLFGLERYTDAVKLAQNHQDCLAWAAGIYEAAALQATGNPGGASGVLGKTIANFPQKETEITRLWVDLTKQN